MTFSGKGEVQTLSDYDRRLRLEPIKSHLTLTNTKEADYYFHTIG